MATETVLGYPMTNYFKINRTGNLGNDVASYIKLKEGGLTDNPADSASKFPTGVTYTGKDGATGKTKTTDKWHTNKGITWQTFKAYADKLGYKGDAETFYAMPDDVWLKIYNEIYYKPFANLTKSPLINYYISLWAWGSGVGGAKNLLKKIETPLNDMIDKVGEQKTLALLIDARIKFYDRLIEKEPKNAQFRQGWRNAALSFYKNFSDGTFTEAVTNAAENATEVVKKNPKTTIVIFTMVTVGLYLMYKAIKPQGT